MALLPTVVLRHQSRAWVHYDWMLTDAGGDPSTGRLWTARVEVPPDEWGRLGRWLLEPITPHRRDFLCYQGPLTGDRGSVARVDQGGFKPLVWRADRILIDLCLIHCRARVLLTPAEGGHWRAVVVHRRRTAPDEVFC